jgi:predicted AlkP superfamily pyrophosphatase or phosphodiesterase
MKKMIYPDFKNNIINISSSFSKYLCVETDKFSNAMIDSELVKDYKNVIFIVFDGLGKTPIINNLNDDSYLRRNVREYLTSTYPSTTTNATTTLMSNLYPMEHGWFAWSLFFPSINRCLDLFTGRDSETLEIIDPNYMYKNHDFCPYFEKSTRKDIDIYSIFPEFVKKGRNVTSFNANNINSLFTSLKSLTNKGNKKFVYCYYDEPDKTMHMEGVTSKKTKLLIENIEMKVEEFMENESDTLLVITADHGLVDVNKHIELREDETLLSFLRNPLFFDGRTPGFNLRDNCERKFLEYMGKKYGKDLLLLSKKELLEKGIFGLTSGDNSNLLPDYVGIVTSDSDVNMHKASEHSFKAHHSSLGEEMYVPLIIIGKK